MIQALSGTLPTKINKTIGLLDKSLKICKRCKMHQIEDDEHVLANSTFNKDFIYTKRHDYTVNKIAKELAKSHPDAKVWKERSWRSGTELLRPKITMVQNKKAYIVEITIPHETSNTYLEKRALEKVTKYERLLEHNELQQVECEKGEVIPIIIGALGTIDNRTNVNLKKLRFQNRRDALQMVVSIGSVNILNNHFRRSDFG